MKNLLRTSFILTISLWPILSQSYQDLQKLQEEYKKALERQSIQKPKEITDAEKTAKSTALPDKLIYSRKDIESLLVNTENLLKELEHLEDSVKKMPYVGYDFFTKRDSIPFWQNLPISDDYILGAGDEIIISLWGESNALYTETINRDGEIFIENIGVFYLGGKSLNDAKNHILSVFSRVYSTLIGSSPKSFLDITLGELKSVNVHFAGFVNIPGVHMIHPFSNVVTGLIQAGGVNYKGSLREIRILRKSKTINIIDIYDHVINGMNADNIRLMDQDVVFVPPRKSTVPISGRVLRPGYYEMIDNETTKNLIDYSGGLDRFSSGSIFIFQNDLSSNEGFLLEFQNTSDYVLKQGDSVHVPMTPSFSNYVRIEGQVKNPGKYPFNKEMRLSDILKATMSLNDEDFYGTMNLTEVELFRRNPSGRSPIKILTGFSENILLKNGDHINIKRKMFFKPIESIIITGEVKKPGSYPVNNSSSLTDILDLSGGYSDNALEDGIEIFRDSVKISWENKNFILESGDSLNVLKRSGLIFIGGEVNVPGYLSFNNGDSIKKYIRRAGGFSSYAQIDNIYLIHPNGNAIPVSRWRSPKVLEGSKIIVGQQTISGNQRVTGWQAFSMISNQATNIITTILTLSLLASQSNAN
ncbi:MAG: hypothetical protein CL882_02115 [Dehalococcoidia bacterium]|nr:hypothetical protein [Dehalococcoidia bacterium]